MWAAVLIGTPVEVFLERKLLICRKVRMWAADFKVSIVLGIAHFSSTAGRATPLASLTDLSLPSSHLISMMARQA